METEEIKITLPEDYEIDKENSTSEYIKFRKKKRLTYENIADQLFTNNNGVYYINSNGDVVYAFSMNSDNRKKPNNATCKKQLEKLLAINKLMNVAKYLNGNWKPNWENINEDKYYLRVNRTSENTFEIGDTKMICSDIAYFRSRELAQQAINILGEYTIRLALSTDW